MNSQLTGGRSYNQFRALWGIFRSSLIATRRNPSSIVFGLIFPLVFIVIFGYLGQGGQKLKVALGPNSDTNNPIYQALTASDSNVDLQKDLLPDALTDQLKKGQLDGEVTIINDGTALRPHYRVDLTTSNASPQQSSILGVLVHGVADKTNLAAAQGENKLITVNDVQVSGREYRTIDFILPGMLGFSLLNAGIFATAFVFLTLRQTLVIKRFFTTPVNRISIILGEAFSRLVVAVVQAAILIFVGYKGFNFTLIHGGLTFFEMLVLCGIGLIIFLGFGLVISSVAKDERTVAPMSQLVTLPQFLLAGTFFPIDQLPKWLQHIANVLPLTYLNDAMRKVAFEGASILDVKTDLFWLAVWGVVIYIVVVKVFRWEPNS